MDVRFIAYNKNPDNKAPAVVTANVCPAPAATSMNLPVAAVTGAMMLPSPARPRVVAKHPELKSCPVATSRTTRCARTHAHTPSTSIADDDVQICNLTILRTGESHKVAGLHYFIKIGAHASQHRLGDRDADGEGDLLWLCTCSAPQWQHSVNCD